MRMPEEKGVTVRYVYPKGPAATAGIAAGDTLLSLDGKPIRGRIEMIEKIGSLEPGAAVEIELRRDESVRKLKIVLAPLPEALPPTDLPPATDVHGKSETAAARVGALSMKTPEYPNDVLGLRARCAGVRRGSRRRGLAAWPGRIRLEATAGPVEAALRPLRVDPGGAEVANPLGGCRPTRR